MNLRGYIILLLLGVYNSTEAQYLSKKEVSVLHSIVETNWADREKLLGEHRSPELIFCFLKIDSLGKVSNIDIVSDEKKGVSYKILSNITPDVFRKYTFSQCVGKKIMLPIMRIEQAESDMFKDVNNQSQPSVLSVINNLIIISALNYKIPTAIVDHAIKAPKFKDSFRHQ